MSERNEIHITAMTRREFDYAVEAAAAEGWNPGLHDGDVFYSTDPMGFFVARLDQKPVGCISAVSYEGLFGFIGFYIVDRQYRGKGYGIKLWNEAMKRLEGHNIGLDGVIEQQKNYKKSGFTLAYSNIRFEWIKSEINTDFSDMVSIEDVPFNDLTEYDSRFFPTQRSHFLTSWINMPESKSFAYVKGDELQGYGVIRKCRQGYKIGPLFSDNSIIAGRLYNALSDFAGNGDPIYLDVPEINMEALGTAESYGMKKVFATARMYTGEEPKILLHQIFGVTSFELG